MDGRPAGGRRHPAASQHALRMAAAGSGSPGRGEQPSSPLLRSGSSSYTSATAAAAAAQQQQQRRRRQRSALMAIGAIFISRVAQNGFALLLPELLLSRACASEGLAAYPSKACTASDHASTVSIAQSGLFSFATNLPCIAVVSIFAMLSDARGRKVTLVVCYLAQALQYLLVWLLPAGRICIGSRCVDSFWVLLCLCGALSALVGDSMSTTLAVVADATEQDARWRSTLYGLTEVTNMAGATVNNHDARPRTHVLAHQILDAAGPALHAAVRGPSLRPAWPRTYATTQFGPLLTGAVGSHWGLRAGFAFSFAAMALSVFCVAVLYTETLQPLHRKRFSWRRANPIGSMSMLLRHPILVRALLLFVCVDLANNQSTVLYYTHLRCVSSPRCCIIIPTY
jgi:MFS family permease